MRRAAYALLLVMLTFGIFARAFAQDVPYQKILHSDDHPQDWLTYGGNYASQRFSRLAQINTKNVSQLKVAWIYQPSRAVANVETSPIVVDGVMYVTEPPSTVTAIDARTGLRLWSWSPKMPDHLVLIGLYGNSRGVAILDKTVYVGTADAHLVALDAKTGGVKWDVHVADNRFGYSMSGPPLAIDGKVIVGTGGSEAAVRGLLDCYDAKTGKRLWRLWTVPRLGEPGADSWGPGASQSAGGTTWNNGSYDPATNTIYWGTGNPAPDFNDDDRPGDNLYTCSLLAIDANTGKIKWHFQFSPHENHDWDSAEPPVLFDAKIGGKLRHLVALANRNAFYYVLDRDTGEFITGVPFAKETWAKGLDAKGRPILNPNQQPTLGQGTLVYPSITGAVDWPSPSYSPDTGLFYVSAHETGAYYIKGTGEIEPGAPKGIVGGGGVKALAGDQSYGAIRALVATTGKLRWQYKLFSTAWVGTLATAGGLVFSGSDEGNFFALDASTGKPLWQFYMGHGLRSNPVTYALDGKQYVFVTAGNAYVTFTLP
ncbi:MAG TPA: PQQ-dependent dehydrogenase, methanol/ethanol family [Candidatus Dormibacteraeota bacterium]|nr:PQQ-dependent dehydrogenase, methanol/ethanol family [Candidatus Dormibacteraeota bacterium]